MQWRDFPLPDGSYSDDCRPFTQQDVCNYLPTFAEAQGTRSRVKYVPVPGLVAFAGVGNGPHRGIRDVEGKLFVVSGNTLYQVATDGTATSRGTIPGTRRVSMVHNQIDGGNELIIATGDNSYVWNTVTETLTATGVPLLFVDFLNQLIIGIDVARRFWRWSGLADATSWNSLDVEAAESSPDRLVGQIVSQGEVLLFGERTIEVWSNSPSGNLTFQRSTVIEKGCANGNTICRLDNTVYFVGNDSIAYRLQGYTPVPISSKAITDSISDGDPSKLFAFTWEDKGYVCYYLTAQDGNTWGFDVTCQKWHRRESFGLTRWRVNTLCKWNGDWYAGDYSNGKLYRLEWGNVYEGCEIMPRTLRTGVMHNNGNRMFISALKLLVNTGREPSVADDAPSVTGSLPDGTVGDVVSYQLTVTPAYPGQAITVSATGLPTGLSCDADGLITGTLTTTGVFTPTYIASSECGDGTHIDSVMVGTFTITGDVPDAGVGSESSGTYDNTGGIEPITYAVTDGTFPPGLTLATDGSWSGTHTTSGEFAWTVTGTDDNGNTATLNDTCLVSLGEFWMVAESTTTARQNKLWIGTDGLSYPTSTTRTPNIIPLSGGAGGPLYAGGGQMIIYSEAPEGTCEVEVITDPDVFPITTTIVTVPDDFVGGKLGLFGDTLAAPVNGAAQCLFSVDKGANWLVKAGPSADDVLGLGRLSSGRWLCVTGATGTPKFYYSDVALPASSDWLLASGASSGGFALWTNGSVGVRFDNLGNVWRTADGTAWASATHGLGTVNPYTGIAFDDTFLIGESTGPTVLRSTDSGVTWARITISGTSTSKVAKLDRDPISGVIVASLSAGLDSPAEVWRSLDGGASWTQATIPFTPSADDQVRVGFNPNGVVRV